MDLSTLVDNLLVPGTSIAEKIVRPLVVYAFLVAMLRVGGQRSLGQMNAFDLVVLLMLSNTVQNAIIGNDTSLVGGLIGGTTLVFLNLAVVHFLFHHQKFDAKLEGEPITVVRDGKLLEENCHRALLTPEEVLAAVHHQGVSSIDEVEQAILETSGTITVTPRRPTREEAESERIQARLTKIESILNQLVERAPR